MSLKVGSTDVSAVYVGGTAASAVYLGSTQVWSATPPATWHNVFPWAYSWVADDLANGAVSSWTDGTAAVALTQGTGTKQPVRAATSGPNSQPAVTFDGTDDFLKKTGTISVGQPDTIVIIGKFNALPGSMWVTDGDGTAGGRQLIGANATTWQVNAASGITGGTSNTSPHVFRIWFTPGTTTYTVDGATAFSGGAGPNGLTGFTLGATNAGTSPANATFAAVGICSGDATASGSWSALQAFITTKWGLTA